MTEDQTFWMPFVHNDRRGFWKYYIESGVLEIEHPQLEEGFKLTMKDNFDAVVNLEFAVSGRQMAEANVIVKKVIDNYKTA